MDKYSAVTDKVLKEYAIRKLGEANDELFWRIIWTCFLYDSVLVMNFIKDVQVEEAKEFYKKSLLYELKVSKLEKEREENESRR